MEKHGPDSERHQNRAILPLLQPPDLQQSNMTNFCIDNILRPDFGRRLKDRTLGRDGFGLVTRGSERTGTKPSRTGTTQHGGSGKEEDPRGSEGKDPNPEARRLEAGRTLMARDLLWPAWVYCTRYSDRPSAGGSSRAPEADTAMILIQDLIQIAYVYFLIKNNQI